MFIKGSLWEDLINFIKLNLSIPFLPISYKVINCAIESRKVVWVWSKVAKEDHLFLLYAYLIAAEDKISLVVGYCWSSLSFIAFF